MSDAGTAQEERVRWGWVLLCFVVGLLLTVAPFVLEDRLGWTGAAPSTMTNVGTAFLLAAVLFFLERRFVMTVRRAAGQAAGAAVSGVAEELRQTTQDLRTSIDELQTQAVGRAAAAAAAQDAKIARLDEDISFGTLTHALSEAYGMNALAWNAVTVLGGRSLSAPRFAVSWLSYDADDSFGTGDALIFELEVTRNPEPGRSGRPVVRRRWVPDQSADEFGAELILEMQRHGFGPEARIVDLGALMANLRSALADALAARRDDGWFSGRLMEYADPWAVTSVGLEHRDHGVVLMASEFPPTFGPLSADRPKRPPKPAAPNWADDAEFNTVYGWAEAHFPPSPSAALYARAGGPRPVLPGD